MEEGNLVARQINRDILRFHRQLVYSYVWLPTKRSFHLLPPASEGLPDVSHRARVQRGSS